MTGIAWHASLAPDVQDQIREVIAAAARADGIAPVSEQVLRELPLRRTEHLLATDLDVDNDSARTVVGYLNLTPAPPRHLRWQNSWWHPTPAGAASVRRW